MNAPKISEGKDVFPRRKLSEFMTDPETVAAFEEGRAAQRAAALIRQMRRDRKLTQRQLADALKVKDSRIAELERGDGRQGPTLGMLERVAFACGYRLTLSYRESDAAAYEG